MRNGVFWLSLVLAAVAISVIGLTSGTKTAQAQAGDVCKLTVWDSTGQVLGDGDVVGGDGSFYLVFRVEDDAFGYLGDFLDGPAQELLVPLYESVDDLNQQLADLVSDPDWIAANLPAYDENTTADEIWADIMAVQEDPGFSDPQDPDYDDLHEAYELLTDAYEIVAEKEAYEEVIREIEEVLENINDVDEVVIDAQTGAARITSQAEVTSFDWVKPSVAHILIQPNVGSQYVDHIFPDWFSDPDGHDLDSISAWLTQVAGVPAPVNDAADVCGGSASDGWGFVDMECITPGSFNVNVIPHRFSLRSELLHRTINLVCPGAVETAEISASPMSLETQPVGNSSNTSLITVTTYDAAGDNVDGAEVMFLTNNCTFTNPLASSSNDKGMTPAGGGTTVTVWSDTDSTKDASFLDNNPLQSNAGTAEVYLNCANGTPGTAKVTAIVPRNGADIELKVDIALVGPTSSTGLTLTLSADSLVCGETLLATAKAVDANGVPVSDGTVIYFTTDTSSGIIGGVEGGQGANDTVGGETAVTVAIAPNDPGIHTLIAYTVGQSGAILAQTFQEFECTAAVAAAAPTSAPASDVNSITPPNTGDAGLAAADSGVAGLLALLAVVASAQILFLVGLRANLLCLIGRRR